MRDGVPAASACSPSVRPVLTGTFGGTLDKVDYQHRLGRLFDEFNMDADLVLTDNEGHSFVLDTKYKLLDTTVRHAGLSQADFYQMYAYGNAGTQHFKHLVLLYPAAQNVVRRTFHQKDQDLQLHIRQFDPRDVYDRENGDLNPKELVKQLNEAFADIGISASA